MFHYIYQQSCTTGTRNIINCGRKFNKGISCNQLLLVQADIFLASTTLSQHEMSATNHTHDR